MVEILTDQQRKAEQVCNEGIDLCQENDLEAGHKFFLQAYALDPGSPKICSWLGYTTAIVERKVQKGLDLCRKAVESEFPDAMFYRNIGKIYLILNNKRAAVGAFARGLQIHKGNRYILQEWEASLGFRRRTAFPFLSRGNPINKYFGKFTWWLSRRKKG